MHRINLKHGFFERERLKLMRAGMLGAVNIGVAEADRLNAGDFDGFYGNVPEGASTVLQDCIGHLRHYLRDKGLSEQEILSLLAEKKRSPEKEHRSDDVELALSLLNMIASAWRVEGGAGGKKFRNLIFGKFGERDIRRQQGTKQERRPEITAWIQLQLTHRPDATREELWTGAPEKITEQIGQDRFYKRVSAARRQLGPRTS